jgi:hypothetical protein
MSIRQPYREIVAELFPDLPVIADELGVVGLANYIPPKQKIRRELNLGAGKPGIGHKSVESFCKTYELRNRQAARELYERRDSISDCLRADFKGLISAAEEPQGNHPISDGQTEAMKVIAKIVNRTGRGYSFEVVRARALFGQMRKLPHPNSPASSFLQTDRTKLHRVQNTFLWEHLLRLQQNSCMSCKGAFAPSELFVSRLMGFSKADPGVNVALLCPLCEQRFGTEPPESGRFLLGSPVRS